MKRKWVTIGIILFFTCPTVSPCIYANLTNVTPGDAPLNQKTIRISCQYVTYTEIEKTEKEILFDDYNRLLHFLNESNDNATVAELERIELLPRFMDAQKVRDIISGEYGKRELSKYQNVIGRLSLDGNSTRKTNMFCKIQGDAVDSIYRPFWLSALTAGIFFVTYPLGVFLIVLDTVLNKLFRWYPLFGFEYDWGMIVYIGFLLIDIPDVVMALGEVMGEKNSLKLNGCTSIEFDDAFHVGKPNLMTSGLYGDWEIHNNRSISINLLGFTGLWITIPDMQQDDGCEFKGYCLYVGATYRDF